MDSPVDMEISDGSISNSSDMEIEDPDEDVAYVSGNAGIYDHTSSIYSTSTGLVSSSLPVSQPTIESPETSMRATQSYLMPSLMAYARPYHDGYQARQAHASTKSQLESEAGHTMQQKHYDAIYATRTSNLPVTTAQKALLHVHADLDEIKTGTSETVQQVSVQKLQGSSSMQTRNERSRGICFDTFDDSDSDESFVTAPGSPVCLSDSDMDLEHGEHSPNIENEDPEAQLGRCQRELQLLDEKKETIEKAKNKLGLDMLGLQVKLSIERNRKNMPKKMISKTKKVSPGNKRSPNEVSGNDDQKRSSIQKHASKDNMEQLPNQGIEISQAISTPALPTSLSHIPVASASRPSLIAPSIPPVTTTPKTSLQPLPTTHQTSSSLLSTNVEQSIAANTEVHTVGAKSPSTPAPFQPTAVLKNAPMTSSTSPKQKVIKTPQSSSGAIGLKAHVLAPQLSQGRDDLALAGLVKTKKKKKPKQTNEVVINSVQGGNVTQQHQTPSLQSTVDKQAPTILQKMTFAAPLDPGENTKGVFKPYRSPLGLFGIQPPEEKREIGHQLALKPDNIHKSLCAFEANGGTCNDDTCTELHFRDF
ncbi:hypothetical protein DFQ28_007675 [Apophysomyces sp. BC1034]|nr:hypothetical protein DFQ30_004479 [Apophysomyces sp. BC1015]KAG0192772.1 hypothetical protein DFQ28_007675 [Apophysomyces sp. BC1034]